MNFFSGPGHIIVLGLLAILVPIILLIRKEKIKNSGRTKTKAIYRRVKKVGAITYAVILIPDWRNGGEILIPVDELRKSLGKRLRSGTRFMVSVNLSAKTDKELDLSGITPI